MAHTAVKALVTRACDEDTTRETVPGEEIRESLLTLEEVTVHYSGCEE